MITASLSDFSPPAQVLSRNATSLGLCEGVLLRLILLQQGSIFKRAKKALAAEWDSFEIDQKVDPFGPHSRVEIGFEETPTCLGLWDLMIYWSPEDEGYARMHLAFKCFLSWPLSCEPVF